MKQFTRELSIQTNGKGLYPITREVVAWVQSCGLMNGLLTLFIQHTSASLLVQENADPDVQVDLKTFFNRLVPEDRNLYVHTIEGPDDMPAHIRAALTQTHLGVPLLAGRLALGTWQGLYVFEHRASPHKRSIAMHLLGE